MEILLRCNRPDTVSYCSNRLPHGAGAYQLGTRDFQDQTLTTPTAPGRGPEKGTSRPGGRSFWLVQASNQHVGPTCVPHSVSTRRGWGVIGCQPPLQATELESKGVPLSETPSCKITFLLRQVRELRSFRRLLSQASKASFSYACILVNNA
eukprot:scaffold538_cov413-Pavlova_lutheri.AAC.6